MALWHCKNLTRPMLGVFLFCFFAPAIVLGGQGGGDAAPASLDEIAQVIDLRVFPKPAGAVPQKSIIAASVPCLGVVRYDVPGGAKEQFDFYTAKLIEAGWTEAPKTDKRIEPRYFSETGGNMTFVKNGFTLFFMIHKSDSGPNIAVHIQNHGNVDTRKLPQLDGANREQDQPQQTRYSTPANVAAAAAFTRAELNKLGWQEINRRSAHTQKDLDLLIFRQRAIRLDVHVSVPPDMAGRTAVNYSTRVLNDELPTPPDASEVELEDGDYNIEPPLELKFQTRASMESVADFCRKELAARGWKFRQGAGMMQKTLGFYYFDGVAKDEMRLDMKRPADMPTSVVLRRVTPEMLRKEELAEARARERAQKQRVEQEARRKQREMKLAASKKAAEEKKIASLKARPRDIPIPEDATDVVADTFFNRLTFFCPSDRATIYGFYRDELKRRGWTEQVKSSPLVTGYARFGKGKASLTVTITPRRGKTTEVQLSTRSVEWDLPQTKD